MCEIVTTSASTYCVCRLGESVLHIATVSLMHSEWCTYIVLVEHGEYVSKERSMSTGMRTSESVSVCYV